MARKLMTLTIPEMTRMTRRVANGLVSAQAVVTDAIKMLARAENTIKKLEAKIKKLESKKK